MTKIRALNTDLSPYQLGKTDVKIHLNHAGVDTVRFTTMSNLTSVQNVVGGVSPSWSGHTWSDALRGVAAEFRFANYSSLLTFPANVFGRLFWMLKNGGPPDDFSVLKNENKQLCAADAHDCNPPSTLTSLPEQLSDYESDNEEEDDNRWAKHNKECKEDREKSVRKITEWQPMPTRAWLEPLVKLIDSGMPFVHRYVQGVPVLGSPPEVKKTVLPLEPMDDFRYAYNFINKAINRERLINDLNSALDHLELSLEKTPEAYHGVLNKGRELSAKLTDTFFNSLNIELAFEVLVYLHSDKTIEAFSGRNADCGNGYAVYKSSPSQADEFSSRQYQATQIFAANSSPIAPLVETNNAVQAASYWGWGYNWLEEHLSKPVKHMDHMLSRLMGVFPIADGYLLPPKSTDITYITDALPLQAYSTQSQALSLISTLTERVTTNNTAIRAENITGSTENEIAVSKTEETMRNTESKVVDTSSSVFSLDLSRDMLYELIRIKCYRFMADTNQDQKRRDAVSKYYYENKGGVTIWRGNALMVDLFAIEYQGGLVVFSVSQDWHTFIPKTQHTYSTRTYGYSVNMHRYVRVKHHTQDIFDYSKNEEFKSKARAGCPRYESELGDWIFAGPQKGKPYTPMLTLSGEKPIVDTIWEYINPAKINVSFGMYVPFFYKFQNNLQLYKSEEVLLLQQLIDDVSNGVKLSRDDYVLETIAPVYLKKQLALAHSPFFEPVTYIKDVINNELGKLERNKVVKTGLTADSLLTIKTAHANLSDFVEGEHTVSVFQLLTGAFARETYFQLLSVSNDNHAEVITKLSTKIRNLQYDFINEINNYKNNFDRMLALRLVLKSLIFDKCLSFIGDSSVNDKEKKLITKLLKGEVKPMEVSVDNTVLNNVFFIPSGSIDFKHEKMKDGVYFYDYFSEGILISLKFNKIILIKDIHSLEATLSGKEFKEWVSESLPVSMYTKYSSGFSLKEVFPNKSDLQKDLHYKMTDMGGFNLLTPRKHVSSPVRFKEVTDINALAEMFSSTLIEYTKLNVDTLFYTSNEEFHYRGVVIGKVILGGLAIPVSAVACLPLGLVGVMGVAAISGGITAGHIGFAVDDYINANGDEATSNLIGSVALAPLCLIPGIRVVNTLTNPARMMRGFLTIKSTAMLMKKTIQRGFLWQTSTLHEKYTKLNTNTFAVTSFSRILGKDRTLRLLNDQLHSPLSLGYISSERSVVNQSNRLMTEYKRTYPLFSNRPSQVANVVLHEPIRELVSVGSSSVLPVPLINSLEALRKNPVISAMMASPKENCFAILRPTADFMLSKGMTSIQYRGLYMWVNGSDEMPMNHFVVIGRLNGADYVFDLTAGQFPGIDGPQILSLGKWEALYQTTWTRKLIKYGDFNTINEASNRFPASLPGQSSLFEVMGGTQILVAPSWYRARYVGAPVAPLKMPVAFGRRSPLEQAVRSSILSRQQTKSYEYATEMLQKAKILNVPQTSSLNQEFKRMLPEVVSDVNKIFTKSRLITSLDAALRIPSGELVVFMQDGKLLHVMVSLGNGRLVGANNNILSPFLDSTRQVVLPEQLGTFSETGLERWDDSRALKKAINTSKLQVYAGAPNGATPSTTSILAIAQTEMALSPRQDGLRKLISVMEGAGELSSEQAAAFQLRIKSVLMSGHFESEEAWKTLIHKPQNIQKAGLANLPQGTIVLVKETSSRSILVTLGGDKFLSFKMNMGVPETKIISSSNIALESEFLFGKANVHNELRVASLLGRDASFNFNEHTLTITAHGAPGITNYMDAKELANIIKGLMISKESRLDQVRHIELNSCFGAFGRYSTGQILANEFDISVTAYRWRYSAATADDFLNKVKFKPVPTSTNNHQEILESMGREHVRKHEFWNYLLMFYKMHLSRSRRSADGVDEDYPDFKDVMLFALKKLSVNDFLERNQWFYGVQDPNLSDAQVEAFKLRMKMALNEIVSEASATTSNISEASVTTSNVSEAFTITNSLLMPEDSNLEALFMERCAKIFTLNQYAYRRVDRFISG
ncbi:hypothetical protein [Iodobacter fluviatilis]|nr:hypothetical protein [Iodobacter fluviatilis]